MYVFDYRFIIIIIFIIILITIVVVVIIINCYYYCLLIIIIVIFRALTSIIFNIFAIISIAIVCDNQWIKFICGGCAESYWLVFTFFCFYSKETYIWLYRALLARWVVCSSLCQM